MIKIFIEIIIFQVHINQKSGDFHAEPSPIPELSVEKVINVFILVH